MSGAISAVYANEAAVLAGTRVLAAHGIRVLQSHLLADDERAHVGALLDYFDPPRGATVLDLGCGTGRVADLMQEQRPDLDFVLVNQSTAQLALCPARFRCIRADYERLPAGLTADAVMVQYAIGHGDIDALMRSASNVLPRDGVLFIYDLVVDAHTRVLEQVMAYHGYTPDEVQGAAAAAGLRCDWQLVPPLTYAEHFRPLLPAEDFDAVFAVAHPMLFRFVKT